MDALEELEAAVGLGEGEEKAQRVEAPLSRAALAAFSAPYGVMVVVVSLHEYMDTLSVASDLSVLMFAAIGALMIAPSVPPIFALARGGTTVLKLVLWLHIASIALLGVTRASAGSMVSYPPHSLSLITTEVAIAWLILLVPVVLLLFGAAVLLRRVPRNRWERL